MGDSDNGDLEAHARPRSAVTWTIISFAVLGGFVMTASIVRALAVTTAPAARWQYAFFAMVSGLAMYALVRWALVVSARVPAIRIQTGPHGATSVRVFLGLRTRRHALRGVDVGSIEFTRPSGFTSSWGYTWVWRLEIPTADPPVRVLVPYAELDWGDGDDR